MRGCGGRGGRASRRRRHRAIAPISLRGGRLCAGMPPSAARYAGFRCACRGLRASPARFSFARLTAVDLVEQLRAARAHTRRVVDDLAGERELGPKLAIVNPPRWEVGHVGWFQEYWCLRGGSQERPSILPNADALYNSATVPHDTRWELPLPSFSDTLAYRDEVLERVVSGRGKIDPYFIGLAVRHELMHAEAFHYTRQTLGYSAPLENTVALKETGGDLEMPGGLFRLGAERDNGFAFDNEKWSHPVVLEPYRIARRPVTYGEY